MEACGRLTCFRPVMSDQLGFGLFSVNAYACSRPAVAARIARLAEAAGFESLWAGEHVVLPDPQAPPSPMDPEDPILDPLVALANLAGQTTRVRLGTGVIILPQRNPLVLAKQVASLDALSSGRLILGLGVGYLEPEMSALGVPLAQRGGRTDEYLAAMRSIWYAEHPAFDGRFVRFSGVQARPRPGRLPIVVGGHTPAAFRRAVEQAHGWYGFGLDLAGTAECLDGLRQAASRYRRPAELGDLEISVTPWRGARRSTTHRAEGGGGGIPDLATVVRFQELGVHRLILMPSPELDEDGLAAYVAQVGETLIRR
jgi:probable F420-dependent oxidoreductase